MSAEHPAASHPPPAAREPSSESGLPTPVRSWGLDVLHLFGLSALTLVQPLLDRLQHNPGYITQEGLGAIDLALLAGLLLCLPPLLLLAIEGLARLLGRPARERAHVYLMGLLCALLLLPVFNSPLESLRIYGVPAGWVALMLAAFTAWWLMRSYRRHGWVSSLATFLAAGLVVFPGMFFASQRIAAICFPGPPPVDQAHAGNPVPVVVVVFDGLSGMSLLNENHEIDAVRYPNFARLTNFSTYYRNASTVHYRTDNALPSILSGRIPKGDQPPVQSEYPINLFTLLQETQQYDLTVFEPYTRLCPSELRYLPIKRSRTEHLVNSLYALGTVYWRTSIPHDLPIPSPEIPRAWFRQPEAQQLGDAPKTGLMIYPWDADRQSQINHFLKCLEPSERPVLRFLHLVTPHYPWIYLPSGHRYAIESSSADFPIGAHGTVGEMWGPDELGTRSAWRRYLLQLMYADRCLGQILDRLTEQNLLDQSLLVVAADHGVAFKAGLSRRDPVPETLPSIVPVPLFIKLPGQTSGSVTDRNVESIDILPTIADVLQMDIPVRPGFAPVDGASLLNPRETPRPRKTLVMPSSQLAIDPEFPQKYSYVRDLIAAFGTGAVNDHLLASDVHPEWVGRKPSEFRQGPQSDLLLGIEWGSNFVEESMPDVIPCFFKGEISEPHEILQPRTIAVAVNGEIAGVTRTLDDPESPEAWSILVDESRFHPGQNEVLFYEVIENGQRVELRPCRPEFGKRLIRN